MIGGMELRELRMFLTLTEELHFGRTADRLGLTPSRVSQTIGVLEARLGGRLFDRTSRRVALTPLGQRLARSLRPAYDELERALYDAREAALGVTGSLRVCVRNLTLTGPHLPEILSTFKARHPTCRVDIDGPVHSGFQLAMARELRESMDITAVPLPTLDPDLAVGPVLTRQRRVAVVADQHPLASLDAVSYEELADYVVGYLPGLGREVADSLSPPCAPSGRPLVRREVRSFSALSTLVKLMEIVDVQLESFEIHYGQPGMRYVPIHDLPPVETAWAWLASNQSPKIVAFVHATRDVLAAHCPEGTVATPEPPAGVD
jgi:DNA-binding transcriptional LysR family regulator